MNPQTTVPAPQHVTPKPPGLLRVSGARAAVELRTFFREKDAIIFIFAFPTIMLLIFGTVLDREMADGVRFSQYFLAGMLAAGLMLSSFQSLAVQIAVERDDGSLKRLMGSPMPREAYFLGKMGLVLGTAVPQTVLLLATATLVFGVRLPTSPDRWLTFAWVSVLAVASGTLLGVAFSSLPRSGKSAAAVVTPVVLVLQFISGVFFVYNELPEWMQTVAAVFPLKWMAQGMRSVFLPDSFEALEVSQSWQHPQVALVLILWSVVGLVLCVRTFRWQRRDER